MIPGDAVPTPTCPDSSTISASVWADNEEHENNEMRAIDARANVLTQLFIIRPVWRELVS